MPLLDAALAFALTMLVVATVVTQIVSFIHKSTKLRSKQFHKLLSEFFNDEVMPVIEREVGKYEVKVDEAVASELAQRGKELTKTDLFTEKELTELLQATSGEVTDRIAKSVFGQKLKERLGAEADVIITQLGKRYEVVSEKFRDSFREHSRAWATAVALVLALVINIDSIRIANSYIGNATLTQSVIAQQDAFVDGYTTLTTSLDAEGDKDSISPDELEQAFNKSRQEVDRLSSAGFPIGWTYFPHSGIDKADSNEFQRQNNTSGWLMWGLGVLLTGVLTGLGAPFWYDAVTGIARFTARVRGGQAPVTQPAEGQPPAAPTPTVGTSGGAEAGGEKAPPAT